MRARWWLGAAVLAVCLTGPIAESFDWWDQAQPVADDTETNVVFVALSVGLALSVAAIVVQWFASFVSQPTSRQWLRRGHRRPVVRIVRVAANISPMAAWCPSGLVVQTPPPPHRVSSHATSHLAPAD